MTEVLIVVTIALVGASAFVFLEFDEQPAEYEVIVEGEGYVDPAPMCIL